MGCPPPPLPNDIGAGPYSAMCDSAPTALSTAVDVAANGNLILIQAVAKAPGLGPKMAGQKQKYEGLMKKPREPV